MMALRCRGKMEGEGPSAHGATHSTEENAAVMKVELRQRRVTDGTIKREKEEQK